MPSNEKICIDSVLAIKVGAAIGAHVVSMLPAEFWEDAELIHSLLLLGDSDSSPHWDRIIALVVSPLERKKLLAGEDGSTTG